MAWEKQGTLLVAHGFGHQVVNTVLATAVSGNEGSTHSISTSVSRSDGASLRLNKSSSNIYGALYATITTLPAVGGTIIFNIDGGWSSGKIIIIAPMGGGIFGIGDVGILHDTTSGEYRLVWMGSSVNPEWISDYALSVGTDTWYSLQFLHYNPTGLTSLRWRHGLRLLEAGSTTVLERSPWVECNQGGIGYSTLNAFGLSLAEPMGAPTTETPDIYIDGFGIVSGASFGPDDIKFETLLPNAAGTETAWTGAYTDVDDPLGAVDDSNYISSSTVNQAFTANFPSFAALSGAEEEFAVTGFYRGWVVNPAGVQRVQGRLRNGAGAIAANGTALSTSTPAWGYTSPAVRDTSAPYNVGGSGASPLTTPIINGYEFGVQGLGGSNEKRCSAIALQRTFGLPLGDLGTMRESSAITGDKRVPSLIIGGA